jgi:alpha-tubulin suppressor-like RCC1 family protein
MPIVVTKTVRYTGGDYTTLAAALAAVPANLVTADEQWDIQIAESAAGNYEWNFGSSGPRNIGQGVTADATRFIRIKPYPGLGFADRSYSGPTDYDPVKGIALKASSVVLGIRGNYVVIEGLQLKQTAVGLNAGEFALSIEDAGGANSTVKNCVISSNYPVGDRAVVYWFASTMINCLVLANNGTGVQGASTIANTTIINTSTTSTTTIGIHTGFGPPTVKNTAIFGFSTATSSGSLASGSNNNATNLTVVPTNWGSNSYGGLSTSTTFVDSVVSSTAKGNFRLRKSSPLVRGGTRDATNTNDVDIVYRARSLTLPSIGAWEEPSASGTVFPANIRFPIRDVNGKATGTSVDMGDMFLRKDQYLTAGLWAWGYNANGQLGLGDLSRRSSPVQVGSLTTWRQAAVGWLHSAIIKTDGTLWASGNSANGQLGLNDTTQYSSPVQVGTSTNWKQIAAGFYHSVAIKTDGTLWAWGYNIYGQLGLDNTVNYSSPVQVGALADWRQVATGSFHALAIKNDGTLWSWGLNSAGQLGQNNIAAYGSPVQVGALTNWRSVFGGSSNSGAIKTDGTLWAWGNNTYGQLGVGNTVDYSSPVQVGSLNTWRQVTVLYHTAAIQTDGTLWTWGYNVSGQLGLGDTADRSSPVKVGTLTTWKQISAGEHTAAIKTDGTLWSWGYNLYGQLGLNDRTDRSSPVQVGTLTTWKQVTASISDTIAIQSPDLP